MQKGPKNEQNRTGQHQRLSRFLIGVDAGEKITIAAADLKFALDEIVALLPSPHLLLMFVQGA